MEIITYYNFDCITNEELDMVKKYFESKNMLVYATGLQLLVESDESQKEHYDIESEKTHIEVAIKDWADLAVCLSRDFSVEGTVDTSALAGEYMDFRLDYKNGAFSAMYSDWYLLFDPNEYEDYKHFCEAEGKLCTEEEFEASRDKEVYLVEGKDGNALVENIPLVYTL